MKELPIDVLEVHYLTPLPGSEDHQKLYRAGTWMDPDLNKYDLHHITCEHPRMSKQKWPTLTASRGSDITLTNTAKRACGAPPRFAHLQTS
jgi:hypothetical protein